MAQEAEHLPRKHKTLSSNPHMASILCGAVAGRHRGGREINECYSNIKENRRWGMLPRDQKRVTSPQRLKQPMK
jgi:hypothetical protein